MVTIRDYINKCKDVSSKILDEQERIVLANENKIISLNKNQFTDGYGNDGKDLINTLNGFSGYYSPNSEKIGLYDFYETGSFIKGLNINMSPSKNEFSIFSTGTGSGDKSLFFTGYTNLFGLDKKNQDIVNYEIVYPELMKFIKQYL